MLANDVFYLVQRHRTFSRSSVSSRWATKPWMQGCCGIHTREPTREKCSRPGRATALSDMEPGRRITGIMYCFIAHSTKLAVSWVHVQACWYTNNSCSGIRRKEADCSRINTSAWADCVCTQPLITTDAWFVCWLLLLSSCLSWQNNVFFLLFYVTHWWLGCWELLSFWLSCTASDECNDCTV
jgi:hypothetical protein